MIICAIYVVTDNKSLNLYIKYWFYGYSILLLDIPLVGSDFQFDSAVRPILELQEKIFKDVYVVIKFLMSLILVIFLLHQFADTHDD